MGYMTADVQKTKEIKRTDLALAERRRVRMELFRARYFSFNFLKSVAWKVIRFVLIMGLCYIILYPFFIKIVNAFKGYNDFFDPTVRFLPKNFTLGNIRTVIERMNYWEALRNTFFLATGLSLVQTFISAFIGYGFARFKFKGNNFFFFLVILTLIVPPETIIIPLVIQFKDFMGLGNLIDRPFPYPQVILTATGLGFKNGLYIFMFRQFFKNIPKELEEASYLDGCGLFKTYFKIMFPSATSVLVTVFLLSFSWQWTDTVYTSVFFKEIPFLPNLISGLGMGSEMPIILSNYKNIGAILAILPIALLFIVAQKFFVQSVDRTGLVG